MGWLPRIAFLLALPLIAGCATAAAVAPAPLVPNDVPGFLGQPMRIVVHLPPGYDPKRRYPVLYVNDGQDSEAVGLRRSLQELRTTKRIAPLIVVAIDMPKDRMGAYGLSDPAAARSLVGDSRFGPVGRDAHAYSEWLIGQLVSYVDAHYATDARPRGRAVLGWSLGGLNAFNLGWQYPDVFGTVGAFSPSFWLSAERGTPQAAQDTRLAQRMVAAGAKREGSRFWFEVGDAEETGDRDGDGVIDAVDDARDLVLGYIPASGKHQAGLVGFGYATNLGVREVPAVGDEVAFRVLPGGEHNQRSWARMLPEFLCWAFPPATR